jgi:hypothetical protein
LRISVQEPNYEERMDLDHPLDQLNTTT